MSNTSNKNNVTNKPGAASKNNVAGNTPQAGKATQTGQATQANKVNNMQISQLTLTVRKLIFALFYLNILRFLPIILNMTDQSLQGGGLIAGLGEYLPVMLNIATSIVLLVLAVKKPQHGFAVSFLIWALYTGVNLAGSFIPADAANAAQGIADSAEAVAVTSFGLSDILTVSGLVLQLVFYIIYAQSMIKLLNKRDQDAISKWKVLRVTFIIVYGSSLGAVLAALVPGMEALVAILALILLMTTFISMIFHVYTLQLTARSIRD